MLHGSDRHLLECGLKTTEIPAEVEAEYEIRRKMLHRMGGSGALGVAMLVELLRGLGLGEFEEAPKVVTHWPDHTGQEVDVLYGSKTLRCVLLGLSDMGRLFVRHEERGTLEVPRHSVKLATGPLVESEEVAAEPDDTDWADVADGTAVVVDGNKCGVFKLFDEGMVWVLLNSTSQTHEYDRSRVRLNG